MPRILKKKTERDLERLIALAGQSLTADQRQKIKQHTIDETAGICYRVNLDGNLGVIYAGVKKVSKGYQFQFANYPFYRIVYTLGGSAIIDDYKQQYKCDTGSVYGFVPKESGQIINNSDAPWIHMYIHFTGREALNMYKKTILNSSRVTMLSDPVAIQQIFENIVSESIKHNENSQAICDAYLQILLLKLSSDYIQNPQHLSESKTTYLHCLNYINEHFSTLTNIGEVAEKCSINRAHLCRLFRMHNNISPMAYILKLRLNKAALILIQTDYPIKHISNMLSFKDPYYFSKAFKKIYGISPAIYRKQH